MSAPPVVNNLYTRKPYSRNDRPPVLQVQPPPISPAGGPTPNASVDMLVAASKKPNAAAIDIYKTNNINPPTQLAILATEAPISVLLERGFPAQMLQRMCNIAPGQSGSSIAPSLVTPDLITQFGKDYQYKPQDPLFDPVQVQARALVASKKFPLSLDVCSGCLTDLATSEHHSCSGACLRSWHSSISNLYISFLMQNVFLV